MTYRENKHSARIPELDPFIHGTEIRLDFECHHGDRGDVWSETHEVEIGGSMLDALSLAASLTISGHRMLEHRLTPMNADAIETMARELREWAEHIEQAARQMPRGPQGAA